MNKAQLQRAIQALDKSIKELTQQRDVFLAMLYVDDKPSCRRKGEEYVPEHMRKKERALDGKRRQDCRIWRQRRWHCRCG